MSRALECTKWETVVHKKVVTASTTVLSDRPAVGPGRSKLENPLSHTLWIHRNTGEIHVKEAYSEGIGDPEHARRGKSSTMYVIGSI